MNDIEIDPQPQPANLPDRSALPWIAAVELALLLFVGLGVAVLIRGASAADPDHALQAPAPVTLSLDALPTEVSAMYQYAADHPEHFTSIPCFCGCDRSLGHRNLTDCFVTPSGGWDAHASGCSVCTAEATAVKELLDNGTDATSIRRKIIARFGPPPAAQQGVQP